MEKVIEWLKEYGWMIPVGLFILAFIALAAYGIGDHVTGKTLIIQGDVVGHRYKPAWTDSGIETDLVYDANGNVTPQIRAYSHHHPEQFILTVVGPDGPDTYYVREATYQYYQDGKTIPLGRLIGGYSKRCVSTWIVEP